MHGFSGLVHFDGNDVHIYIYACFAMCLLDFSRNFDVCKPSYA